jgi:hypothetical protein
MTLLLAPKEEYFERGPNSPQVNPVCIRIQMVEVLVLRCALYGISSLDLCSNLEPCERTV